MRKAFPKEECFRVEGFRFTVPDFLLRIRGGGNFVTMLRLVVSITMTVSLLKVMIVKKSDHGDEDAAAADDGAHDHDENDDDDDHDGDGDDAVDAGADDHDGNDDGEDDDCDDDGVTATRTDEPTQTKVLMAWHHRRNSRARIKVEFRVKHLVATVDNAASRTILLQQVMPSIRR